ncbi:MAG: hypothetical protein KDC07_07215 [Chitinophagaceae bacterium]|nr:hypothetical protein [Chitinophagaceae bacterium]MCB9046657.1 hypothetical protein [Chitinophagales bacterium]
MKQRPRRILLRKLLLRSQSNKRLWPALITLCMGTVLLLYAIIVWTGFRDILSGKYDKDSIHGTYVTVSKPIPNEGVITEQKQALFSNTEIRALAALPGVKDLGVFMPGHFPVEVSFTGKDMSFSTNLFIESVPDRFIDNKPLDWYWQRTSKEVPIIISTEFLNLYNFGYAPNEGVPQLTRATISSLLFDLSVGKGDNKETFKARVVGFSDRISSILVPQAFVQYGNKYLADTTITQPSRLIVLVTDPSDELFTTFINERGYITNGELFRLSRLRTIVTAASIGIGLLSVVLLVISGMVLLLFAELTVAKAKDNLHKLVLLGYSPYFLGKFMYLRYVIIIVLTMVVAGILAIFAQVRVAKFLLTLNLDMTTFPPVEVWAALVCITLVLFFLVNRVIKKGVK